jgi:hypothetical protein
VRAGILSFFIPSLHNKHQAKGLSKLKAEKSIDSETNNFLPLGESLLRRGVHHQCHLKQIENDIMNAICID